MAAEIKQQEQQYMNQVVTKIKIAEKRKSAKKLTKLNMMPNNYSRIFHITCG